MTTPVTNNTNTPTPSATDTARTSLAGNFQTFLTLLTTQLQNQDPTSPMDSNQFTQQLVMYSQVEQQIDTNSKLDSLVALSGSQSINLAVSYMGKDVVLSDGTGQLTSGAASWSYGLATPAANTTLTVKDANGNVVYSKTVDAADDTAGIHHFDWDGKNANGDLQNDGLYTLVVSSTGTDGKAISTSVASKATVTGVDLSGSTPQLVIGSAEVPLSSATLISFASNSNGSGSDSSSNTNTTN